MWGNIQQNLNAIAIVIIIVIFGSDSTLKMEFKWCDEQNEVAELTNEKFMNAIDESFWFVFVYSTMLANYQGVSVHYYIINPKWNQLKRFFIPFFIDSLEFPSIVRVICFVCERNYAVGKTIKEERKTYYSKPTNRNNWRNNSDLHRDFKNVKLKAIYVYRLLFLLSFIASDTYCLVDGEFVIKISAFLLKNVPIIHSLGPSEPKSLLINWYHLEDFAPKLLSTPPILTFHWIPGRMSNNQLNQRKTFFNKIFVFCINLNFKREKTVFSLFRFHPSA